MSTAEATLPLLAEVRDALERVPGIILLLPTDVPVADLAIAIEREAMNRFGWNSIFNLTADEAMALPPGQLLGDLLDGQGPIEVPQDMRDRTAAMVLILTEGACTEAEAEHWLRLWAEHFRRFKGLMEQGGGLRVIWVGRFVPHLFRRNYSPPEHWTTVTWQEPDLAELQRYAHEELQGCLSSLRPPQQEFLKARLSDMAGGRRSDLEAALNLVRQVRSSGEWLDRVCWANAEVPPHVPRAMRQLALDPAVQQLLGMGGVATRYLKQEWDRRWRGWEDALWGQGVLSAYGNDLVGLSPLALHVVQREGLMKGRPASPPSETALRLLGRSLYWECLLKDRLVMRLDDPGWDRLVRREMALLTDGDGDLVEDVQGLTLGAFLLLLCRVLPGGASNWDFRDFSAVRNQAAHGHAITWANHWAKLEAIEPLLVQAYTLLAE